MQLTENIIELEGNKKSLNYETDQQYLQSMQQNKNKLEKETRIYQLRNEGCNWAHGKRWQST